MGQDGFAALLLSIASINAAGFTTPPGPSVSPQAVVLSGEKKVLLALPSKKAV